MTNSTTVNLSSGKWATLEHTYHLASGPVTLIEDCCGLEGMPRMTTEQMLTLLDVRDHIIDSDRAPTSPVVSALSVWLEDTLADARTAHEVPAVIRARL